MILHLWLIFLFTPKLFFEKLKVFHFCLFITPTFEVFQKNFYVKKMISVTDTLCLEPLYSYPPDSDVHRGCHNSSKPPQKCGNSLKLVHSAYFSQRLFELSYINPKNLTRSFSLQQFFHRFHIHLFKYFSPQLEDQTDSDFLLNALLLQLVNWINSLNISNDQNHTDSEKLKRKLLLSELILLHLQFLKFLRNTNWQHLTDVLGTLKSFWTKLQLFLCF